MIVDYILAQAGWSPELQFIAAIGEGFLFVMFIVFALLRK